MPDEWLKITRSGVVVVAEACAPGCFCRRRGHAIRRFPRNRRVCIFCRFGHVTEPAQPTYVPVFR